MCRRRRRHPEHPVCAPDRSALQAPLWCSTATRNKFTTLPKEMAARRLLELHLPAGELGRSADRPPGKRGHWLRPPVGESRPGLPTHPPPLFFPCLQNQPVFPRSLEEPGVSLQLMETLQHELPTMETQIPPIHEQFAILEKYEVPVQDDVSSSSPSQPQAVGCQGGESSREVSGEEQ